MQILRMTKKLKREAMDISQTNPHIPTLPPHYSQMHFKEKCEIIRFNKIPPFEKV